MIIEEFCPVLTFFPFFATAFGVKFGIFATDVMLRLFFWKCATYFVLDDNNTWSMKKQAFLHWMKNFTCIL